MASSVRDWVIYHPAYRVLVCIPCGYGIVNVKRHMVEQHSNVPLSVRRDISNYAATVEICSPAGVPKPSNLSLPIRGLPVIDGQACERCGHLCGTDGSIVKHAQEAHAWTKRQARYWRPVTLQTFFRARNYQRYFQVSVKQARCEQDNPSKEAIISQLLRVGEQQDLEEAQLAARVDQELLPADLSEWLRRTKWATKFAGEDLCSVAALAAMPRKTDSLATAAASVERVLGRCRDSIKRWYEDEDNASLVLILLASPNKDDLEKTPFSVHYVSPTHDRYISFWKRYVCFCLRCVYEDGRQAGFLIESEREALGALWCALELGEVDEMDVDKKVFHFSVQAWTHRSTRSSPSSLIHFSAILGIHERKGTFRQPNEYSQALAALLYCGRMLLFEHALPLHGRERFDDCYAIFRSMRDQWLVAGQPTPFDYLNTLLAYALAAGKDMGACERVYWSQDRQTIIYDGQPLAIEVLREFVRALRARAAEILSRQLLFLPGPEEMDAVDLAGMTDRINESATGYSFLSEASNNLQGGRESVLRRLASSIAWSRVFPSSSGSVARACPAACAEYERALEAFMGLLAVLVHITAGAPARGTELLQVQYANSPHAPRNVLILDGQVVIVTRYHKTQSQTGQHRVIPRFLPDWLGQMVVTFLSKVLPTARLLDHGIIHSAHRTFIWASRAGRWGTSRLTKVLEQESMTRMGFRLTVADYRHIAIAVDREHVRGQTCGGLEYEDDYDHVHDLAAAHSSRTADMVYGIDATMLRSLSSRTMTAFRKASILWHQFLGVVAGTGAAKHLSPPPKGPSLLKRPRHTIEGDGIRMSGQVVPWPAVVGDAARGVAHSQLATLFGPGASFRCREQEDAVVSVLSGTTPLVVAIPPSAGKSLVFQLPASVPSAGVSLVVVPLRALLADLARRCQQLGVACVEWTAERPRHAPVTLVVVERAVGKPLVRYAQMLHAAGKLDRIVIDECHLVVTELSYRRRMVDLDELRKIPRQFVLLSGTLPRCIMPNLQDKLLLGEGTCEIRASSRRPNVQYMVHIVGDSTGDDEAIRLVRALLGLCHEGARAVVFCDTRLHCEKLAESLGCEPYHAHWANKDETLAAWTDGRETIIVATTALGCGVDVERVQVVVHVGPPYSAIDFVQGVGRGGRSGEAVASLVVLERSQMARASSADALSLDESKEAMRQFLTSSTCRRARLDEFFDGQGRPCIEGVDLACDVCMRAQCEQEEAERGARLWQERVKERGRAWAAIDTAIEQTERACAVCWAYAQLSSEGGREPRPGHYERSCPVFKRHFGRPYDELRRLIRYEANSCCFLCSRPGDWCDAFQRREKCAVKDIIVPVALAGWAMDDHMRPRLQAMSKAKDVRYFLAWMGRPCRVGGENATNALMAAQLVLKTLLQKRGGVAPTS